MMPQENVEPSCTCQREIDILFSRIATSASLTFEEVLNIESQVMGLFETTKACKICSSDISFIHTFLKFSNQLLLLLKAAETIYPRENSSLYDTTNEYLRPSSTSSRIPALAVPTCRRSQITFGRLILSGDESILIARKLLRTRLFRLHDLLGVIQLYMDEFIAAADWEHSRQVRKEFQELEIFLSSTSAQVRTALGRIEVK
jgi:hypothetical protein